MLKTFVTYPYEELARRLCCAEMSIVLGISFQHCWKKYMGDESVSEFWLQLAKKVSADCALMREQASSGEPEQNGRSDASTRGQ